MTTTPTRIVILGGGFGGLAVARELERLLDDTANVEITLVNRDNFFLFTPMLHEVAASDLDIATIVNPLRKMVRRTGIFIGSVEHIDVERRSVTVSHASGLHSHELRYDHLVIALGAVTNFYAIPGLAERAITMKSLGDAMQLRDQLIQCLEEADFDCFLLAGRYSLLDQGALAAFLTRELEHQLRHARPCLRERTQEDEVPLDRDEAADAEEARLGPVVRLSLEVCLFASELVTK